MFSKRFVLLYLGILTAFCLNGCGGGSSANSGSGSGGGSAISVQITPSATTVDAKDSTTISAAVTNDRNAAGVTWSTTGGTLSNTTTSSATFTAPAASSSSQSFTITATSVADSTKSQSVTINIPANVSIASIASGTLNSTVGAAVNVTLQASGGIGPYTWSVASGAMPFCLTLNSSTGTITGTLTAACAGSYTVTFTVSDSGSPTKLTATTTSVSFTIAAATPIALGALTPATALAGTAYAGSVPTTGGVSPLTCSIISGALPAGLSLNSSTGAITGTPIFAGTANFTVQATDNFGDAPATQAYSLAVSSGSATHFAVAATSSTTITAGGTVSFSVTALDASNSPVNNYSGTVKFTSTDPSAVLPLNATLTNGAGSFQGTLKTAGSQTITATDNVTATITGTTGAITVNAGAASKMSVAAPSAATAGTAVNVTVTAQDTYGNAVSGYSGTVHFSSTDSAATLPANSILTSGTGTFSVTLKTAGSNTVTATDTVTASITGTSNAITVKAAAASKLMVSAPATASAGTAISVSVTAQDAYGNVATTYSGTVHFTSSDGTATLPTNSLLASGASVFQATLKTAGTQTITATDSVTPSITGTTSGIVVNSSSVGHLTIATSTTVTAGSPFNVTVTAQDQFGNTITSYTGTIQFTKSDSGTGAVVPANYTFVSADNGQHMFTNGATLVTAGHQTITATDTVTGSITGTSPTITVNAAAATKFVVSAPGTATAGTALSLSVTAEDQYNNTATGYTGTVHFTSTDGSAVLPADSTLTSGVKIFSVTLKTSGNQTITGTDTSNASINGISGTINVSPGLTITTTTLAAGNIGVPYSQTVTAAGGTGTGYTFTETTNNLSAFGLSLGSNGAITGSPNQFGTVSFTAKVTDSANNTATANLSILIYSALVLPANGSFPAAYTGVPYSASISGTGGSPNVTLTITSALSPANGTLATSITNTELTISGTATSATSESVTVKLTDTTTNAFVTQTYNFSVNAPTAPVLPTANPGAGNVNQAYSGTVTTTGGVGPNYNFTWTINGSPIPSNGTLVSIGDGLSVSDSGSNALTVSGTPTTVSSSPGVQFTAQVKDNASGLISGTQTYTIVVNSAGSLVSGKMVIGNLCGNIGFTLPSLTLSIDTTPTQQVFSDTNGNYSFSTIPDGTYTITPSYDLAPPGSSVVFYPAGQNITVSNGSAAVPDFYVSLGYTVSGSVGYAGTHTGQIYVDLVNNNCSGQGGSGTSIATKGSYTIEGVAPGSYTIYAWMDSTDLGLGQGILNDSDPANSTNTITVGASNVTGANATMTNNDPTSAPTSTPTMQAIYGSHLGVVIAYKPATDSGGVEMATSYDVAWSTSPTLSGGSLSGVTPATTFNYKANGKGSVWILNNSITGGTPFTDGTVYYFQARARNAVGAGAWVVYGGATPTAVTPNPPSGANTISGNVTIPAGVTVGPNAKLYVGFFSQTNGIYATQVASPAVGSNNPFTVNVASGTWQYFGILDQNNDGQIDAGDIGNTRGTQEGPPSVTITSSQSSYPSPTLSNASIFAVIQSEYASSITSTGTTYGYGLNIGGGTGSKLPVSMQLTAASNPDVLVPMDISNLCTNCGGDQFQNFQNLFSVAPTVGDTYTFTVNYSDGSSDTDVTASVTGWNGGTTAVGPTSAPTNLLPSGTTGPSAGTRTQPTFTWAYPSGASTASDYYGLSLCCYNGSNIWDVPGSNSNSNGFTYLQVPTGSITWNVDPSGSGSTVSVSPLPSGSGQTYTWTLTSTDGNANVESVGTWYQP